MSEYVSKLDEFFKFEIDQTVQVKNKIKDDLYLVHIVGRWLEECPGGMQVHYSGRTLHDDGMSHNGIRFNEIELEEYDPKVEKEKEAELQFQNYKELSKMRLRAKEAAKKEIEEEGDEN